MTLGVLGDFAAHIQGVDVVNAKAFIKALPMAVLTVYVASVLIATVVKRVPVVGPLAAKPLAGL